MNIFYDQKACSVYTNYDHLNYLWQPAWATSVSLGSEAPPRVKMWLYIYRPRHCGLVLTYLADDLQTVVELQGRQRIHSSSTSALVVPPTRLRTISDRAFPIVAAETWNSMPRKWLHLNQHHYRPSNHGSHASWKVLDFFFKIPGHGKSWKLKFKVLESAGKISLKITH